MLQRHLFHELAVELLAVKLGQPVERLSLGGVEHRRGHGPHVKHVLQRCSGRGVMIDQRCGEGTYAGVVGLAQRDACGFALETARRRRVLEESPFLALLNRHRLDVDGRGRREKYGARRRRLGFVCRNRCGPHHGRRRGYEANADAFHVEAPAKRLLH